MKNTEDTFTITVVSNGIGAAAGAIQEAISEAYRLNPSIASGLALAKVTALSVGAEGFTVAIAVESGDPERIAAASTKAIASIVLSTIGAIAFATAGATGAVPVIAIAGLGALGSWLGGQIWEHYKNSVNEEISAPPEVVLPDGISDFDFWRIPGSQLSDNGCISNVILSNPDPLVKDIKYVMVDPLVLDLDGDGLEISPLSRGVQFDGNGDTIRTNTSWIDADDGSAPHGICASYAAGAVRCDGTAVCGPFLVRRGLFTTHGSAETIPSDTELCRPSGLPNAMRSFARRHISSIARSAAPIARMQWWMRPGPSRS